MKQSWDELTDDGEPRLPRSVRERRALAALERLFQEADAAVSKMGCPACGECCQFQVTGREPNLFPIELVRLRQAVGGQGRAWPDARPDGACALLDGSGLRCSVYRDRPFGCRTYFCERGKGTVANAAIHALSARLVALSDELDPGASPQPIRGLFGRSGTTG